MVGAVRRLTARIRRIDRVVANRMLCLRGECSAGSFACKKVANHLKIRRGKIGAIRNRLQLGWPTPQPSPGAAEEGGIIGGCPPLKPGPSGPCLKPPSGP